MKKILALILALALCLCSFTVLAADEFIARVETKDANPGDTVELTVNLENNPGIVGLIFVLNFDTEALKLVDVVDHGLVDDPTFGPSYDTVPYKMVWASASPVNLTEDGTLVTLTFEVLPTAKAGMSKVTLSYKADNVFDVDLENVYVKVVNGGVNILGDGAGSDAELPEDFEEPIPKPPIFTPTPEPEDNVPEVDEPVINDEPEVDTPVVSPETDGVPEDEKALFSDVNATDWYYDYVNYVCENKMMNGVSATEFAPNVNLTRAMFVTVLYRMEGEPATEAAAFTDVATGSWYEKAVAWASANGIVNGVSATEFGPDANITREQMAAIIYRYAKYKEVDVSVGENTNILSYEDFGDISEYAIEALQFVCGSGIINGTSATTLAPKENATRAQAAKIFTHTAQLVK